MKKKQERENDTFNYIYKLQMTATNKTNNLSCLLLLLLLEKEEEAMEKTNETLRKTYCVCKEDPKRCARNYFRSFCCGNFCRFFFFECF